MTQYLKNINKIIVLLWFDASDNVHFCILFSSVDTIGI